MRSFSLVETITDIQRSALDTRGYAVVPGALDERWLARLRLAFETGDARDTLHVPITADTPEREAWLALAEHPALRAAATHVLARSLTPGAVHGRCPLPGGGLQGLHADWSVRAHGEPFVLVTALWMIDEFTRDNGATRVVPGSHHQMRAVPRSLAQPLAQHPDELIVTGEAGSLLVFNGHLWHSGTRNRSATPRRAAQVTVFGAPAPRAFDAPAHRAGRGSPAR